MSLLTQLQSLTAQSARDRAVLWPITVTIGNDTAQPKTSISGSGAPPQRTRQADEMRSGYIQRTTRTILLLRSAIPSTATVALGTEFTITGDTHNPGNVGTSWRLFDLTDSNGGAELRCVCFRLDN